jgi:agmatinase
MTRQFADPDSPHREYAASRVVVLPVPLERTTSYGKGTAAGPEAILEASSQVEHYDEELGFEPVRVGIHTLPLFDCGHVDLESVLAKLERTAQEHLGGGKFLLVLGGEHTLTQATVKAATEVCGEIGVVQFDAHADLRNSYEGEPLSHACVMRRVLELGLPTLAVGVRSLSQPEAELARTRRLSVVWGHQLASLSVDRFQQLLEALPRRIYLTIDADYFDPSLIPAVGTPEPGGGRWHPTLTLLRRLFALKEVVAMDLVELAPIHGQPASDFIAARLAYKCLGYLGESSEQGASTDS